MRPRAVIVPLLLAAAGPSCGGGEELPPGPAELRLGTATLDGTGFVDTVDGSDADLVPGAQGGFHVWLKIRLTGIEGRYTIEREARRATDDELVLAPVPQALDVPSDAMSGWWEKPEAMPAFMCPTPIGVQVMDEPILIDVRVRDAAGNVIASDSVLVVPRCRDDLAGDFCHEICVG